MPRTEHHVLVELNDDGRALLDQPSANMPAPAIFLEVWLTADDG